jgi:hypothetical protein
MAAECIRVAHARNTDRAARNGRALLFEQSRRADDKAGDWSEYKLTNDRAGTVEAVRFADPA